MRFAVCLHGAAVVRSARPLHDADRRAIALGRGVGAEIVVVEAVGERGSAPTAVGEALADGASHGIRLVEPALASADAHATGFAFASALTRLGIDLVLFAADADPEGLADVPACVAHHMLALYLDGVINFRPTLGRGGDPAVQVDAVEVTIREGNWIRQLDLPLNAVVGIAADTPRSEPTAVPGSGSGSVPRPRIPNLSAVEVVSLADLNIDPASVRRRDDLRGVIEPAPRPLVTLPSATAVGSLLRR